MKIEKFRKGYRVRKTIKGKTFTLYYDNPPTERKINFDFARLSNEYKEIKESFKTYSEDYIQSKINVLSPSTVRGYRFIQRILSDEFTRLPVNAIKTTDVQKEINRLAASHSPKTVSNVHGFISSVLKFYAPDTVLNTKLPQKVVKEVHVPTREEVRRLFEYAKGSDFEIAIHLAALGLRRGEILALTKDDLHGDVLTIDKAIAKDEHGSIITKTTKTVSSTRQIKIPEYLVEMINNCECIYPRKDINGLYKWLQNAQKELGIPQFKLHAMRYFFASNAHAMGIPDAYIMEMGGWNSDDTMKRVYRQSMDDVKRQMQGKITDFMGDLTK